MKKLFYTPIIAILMILTACATLGLPTADSFTDRLAVAYNIDTAVLESTAILLENKKIGKVDAQNILDQAKNARVGLDIAKSMSKTDITAAESRLSTIRSALVALQAYLATKEPK